MSLIESYTVTSQMTNKTMYLEFQMKGSEGSVYMQKNKTFVHRTIYRVATQFLFQNSPTFPWLFALFQAQIISPLAHFTDA